LYYKGGLIIQHPIDWENYSEDQIKGMYVDISSVRDFEEFRRAENS